MIGARHSHLDNAGYSIDQTASAERHFTPEGVAEALLAEERWRQVLSSLVVCFFARGVYRPDIVLRTLQVSDFNFSIDDIHRIGDEIHREKYRFKIREGFSLDNLRVPKRIFETPLPVGKLDEEFIHKAALYVKAEVLKHPLRPKVSN